MTTVLLFLLAFQDPAPKPAQEPVQEAPAEEVKVVGTSDSTTDRLVRPSYQLEAVDLERYEYDDIHREIRQVPGVSLREEDGFGLRPNIGMRGTATERSSKITLMEDGILLAPAPYAAPAAYYFPMTTRMEGIEAFMGPEVLRYGPLTTGGALNLKSRSIPARFSGRADLAFGGFGYRKGHVWTGHEEWSGNTALGLLVDAAHVRADGFKDLDGGGDTGFEKTELMLKAGIAFGGDGAPLHRVRLKVGYGEEESDETYLGLSDADFDGDPYRRYAGSQLDRMEWDRIGLAVLHTAEFGDRLVLDSAVYHHDFERVWGKLNRFRNGPDLNQILADPAQPLNAVYHSVLTGAQDSANSDEHLMIGTNDRRFVSQGVQSELRWVVENDAERIQQAFVLGLRLHRDEAVRLHTEDAHRMESGRLVFNGSPVLVNLDTTGTAEAVAAHGSYTQRFGDVLLTPRLRLEAIRTEFENHATGAEDDDDLVILLPGLTAAWEVDEAWTLHAGAYRGFSPKAPGQSGAIDPEESINYEIGAAWAVETTRVSATLFFNDYENLLGDDTLSGGGTGSGTQFNGGSVHVWGLELAARHAVEVTPGLRVPLGLTYAWLRSEFQDSFVSDNPQWGTVESGDELPYFPEHQLTATVGLDGGRWQVSLLANYVGFMREEAGTGDPVEYQEVPTRTVIDLSASWTFIENQRLYVNVLNVFDEEYLVSHRPFGARPGLPRQIQVGFEIGF